MWFDGSDVHPRGSVTSAAAWLATLYFFLIFFLCSLKGMGHSRKEEEEEEEAEEEEGVAVLAVVVVVAPLEVG